MSKLVLEFQEQLQKKIAIPIETWDERFTTLAAERTLLEGNMRREKRKDVRDQLAAVFILQGWLDAQKRP
jgi:putative Holliday junction resolvase